MAGPLDGVRVLDCGRWMTAPVCTRILADLGADVIKIESRDRPDDFRGMLDLLAVTNTEDAATPVTSASFDICNRGKRSIAIDFAKVKGQDIFHKLVAKADVLVHNWRQKTTVGLGADFETLVRYNPG